MTLSKQNCQAKLRTNLRPIFSSQIDAPDVDDTARLVFMLFPKITLDGFLYSMDMEGYYLTVDAADKIWLKYRGWRDGKPTHNVETGELIK